MRFCFLLEMLNKRLDSLTYLAEVCVHILPVEFIRWRSHRNLESNQWLRFCPKMASSNFSPFSLLTYFLWSQKRVTSFRDFIYYKAHKNCHMNLNYSKNKQHLETCRKSSETSDRPDKSTALFFMPISSWIIAWYVHCNKNGKFWHKF